MLQTKENFEAWKTIDMVQAIKLDLDAAIGLLQALRSDPKAFNVLCDLMEDRRRQLIEDMDKEKAKQN